MKGTFKYCLSSFRAGVIKKGFLLERKYHTDWSNFGDDLEAHMPEINFHLSVYFHYLCFGTGIFQMRKTNGSSVFSIFGFSFPIIWMKSYFQQMLETAWHVQKVRNPRKFDVSMGTSLLRI
jgi:hypothetical protein